MDDLTELFKDAGASAGSHDCIALLSGGKDSTYALCRLVDMGLNVLAFTLDNGYLSNDAKENISRVVTALGVDHVYGSTPAMKEIFVDSLNRHANVCQGCFKTVYTLSMQEARKRGIRHIVTGLSRGQFFETRLTEDLFRQAGSDPSVIDQTILNARKAYHRVDDAVLRKLDTAAFQDDKVFEELTFVDFYRYCDVSLSEMLSYLDQRVSWIRPADTGRSTNCLINDVGIHIHIKKRGFHNYAFPYSWDVRMGHKTREEALEELNDDIDLRRVEDILSEVGYRDPEATAKESQLIAWYVAAEELTESEIRDFMSSRLRREAMPARVIRVSGWPLTANGKLDSAQLPHSSTTPAKTTNSEDESALNEVEEIIREIWSTALRKGSIGRHDDFFIQGGDSLRAVSVIARLNEVFQIELPISKLFDATTIASLAELVEEFLLAEIEGVEGDNSFNSVVERSAGGSSP